MSENSNALSLLSKAVTLVPDKWFCRSTALVHLRFERELWHLARSCDPDGNAVDVGAWFGPWSYWLSRRVERVFAFEANPEVAAVLELGARENVVVTNIAVSSRQGEVTLAISGNGRGQEGRTGIVEGSSQAATVVVPCQTLDSFNLDRVRFLKVDVEGHELHVLQGAAETLERWHPVVVAELEDRYCDVEKALSFMSDLGYEARVRVEGRWRSLDEFDLAADQRAMLARDVGQTPRGYLGNSLFASGRYANNVVFHHAQSTWSPW
jgi:FkbM family methyltransferase